MNDVLYPHVRFVMLTHDEVHVEGPIDEVLRYLMQFEPFTKLSADSKFTVDCEVTKRFEDL